MVSSCRGYWEMQSLDTWPRGQLKSITTSLHLPFDTWTLTFSHSEVSTHLTTSVSLLGTSIFVRVDLHRLFQESKGILNTRRLSITFSAWVCFKTQYEFRPQINVNNSSQFKSSSSFLSPPVGDMFPAPGSHHTPGASEVHLSFPVLWSVALCYLTLVWGLPLRLPTNGYLFFLSGKIKYGASYTDDVLDCMKHGTRI